MSESRLNKYAVSFYDAERGCWRASKGSYTALIGFSAMDIVESATLMKKRILLERIR